MLTERFEHALIFATQAHHRQRRKGSDVPYVSHLLGVCSLVLEHGGDEDEAIASLLHDAVEDQGGAAMHARIADSFGSRVADIVAGCTEETGAGKPRWVDRKRRYIEHVALASLSVKRVSCADKVHNVRHILTDFAEHGQDVLNRFTKGKAGTVWYYRAMADTFATAHPPPPRGLLAELERCVEELERLTGIAGRGVDWSTL